MKTTMLWFGRTTLSRLKSVLSNSSGVASSLVTRILNLVSAGTWSSVGWYWWFLITKANSGTSAAAAGRAQARAAIAAIAAMGSGNFMIDNPGTRTIYE